MGRRAVVLIMMAFICIPICASVTGGAGGLWTASTEHFDIIYQKDSSETASLIYGSCEDVYDMLVSFFGRDPELHIPVVMTTRFKSLNAYYTCYPANRIVLFDTVADIGELSNFPQTILYIFRHELAHAFQFNLRSDFWQGVSDVVGDIVSVSPLLYLTPALSEGGAVLAESLDGYGRLNDSYAMQIVKQAKLEGLFPSWIDIAGARDTYPGGMLYYNFAGCFLGYLAQTYGVDTVGRLYLDFDRINWFTSAQKLFERRFGKGLDELWADFEAWVPVPDSVLEPRPVEGREEGGNYSDIVLSGGDVYLFDGASASVLRTDMELSSFSEILMLPTEKAGLSIGSDGDMLLVPYVTDTVSQLRLYDISSGSAKPMHFFKSEDRDFHDGCLVRLEGEDYALIYSNEGQNTFLGLYDLDGYGLCTYDLCACDRAGDVHEGERLSVDGPASPGVASCEISLGYGTIASDFVDIGDGRVAFLASLAAQDRIAVLDIATMEVRLVENPEGLSFQSLSLGSKADAPVLCFTCYRGSSDSPSLGIYGELDLEDDNAMIRLSEVEILGGPSNAVRIGDRVLFLSRLYETMRLGVADISELSMQGPYRMGFEDMFPKRKVDADALVGASERYFPIKYLKDGVFLPFGYLDFGDGNGEEPAVGYAVGVRYLTMDPTETFTHSLGAAYSGAGVTADYRMAYSGAVPFSFGIGGVYLPKKRVLGLDVVLEPSFAFELGHRGRMLEISDSLSLGFLGIDGPPVYEGLDNTLMLKYSSSRITGMNHYDHLGYFVGIVLQDIVPALTLGFDLPRVLPWRCDGRHVTNLPLGLNLSAMLDHGVGVFADAEVNVVLYGYEIQKGFGFMDLYMQRFVLDADYHMTYGFMDGSFSHSLTLGAHVYMTPVVGEYLSRLKLGLGAKLRTDLTGDWRVEFSFDV